MKKAIAGLAMLMMAVVGCRAQVPPASSYEVNLTWTAPQANSSWGGCTTAQPCDFAVYRATATAPTFANGTAANALSATITTTAGETAGGTVSLCEDVLFSSAQTGITATMSANSSGTWGGTVMAFK